MPIGRGRSKPRLVVFGFVFVFEGARRPGLLGVEYESENEYGRPSSYGIFPFVPVLTRNSPLFAVM
jgi:hypothetical protein